MSLTRIKSAFFYVRGLLSHKKRKNLDIIREMWGRGQDIERKFELISIYYNLDSAGKAEETVDDKTWADLDLDRVFAALDHTVSAVGRQYLYRRMRTYIQDETVHERQREQYELFRKNQALRERIQIILSRLSHANASYVPHLIYDELPSKPKLYPLIYLSSFISVASLALMFIIKPLFFAVLFFGLLNIVINAIYGKKVYEYFAGLSYLNVMLGATKNLAAIKTGHPIEQLSFLNENRNLIKKLKKTIGWLVIDKSRLGDLGEQLVEYLNLVCLFDLVAFILSLDNLKKYRIELDGLFRAVASLDSTIAVASYLAGLKAYALPVLNDDLRIEVSDIYHPLLAEPVPNSLRLERKSALVTGSNMAGKTTFIKTIGVNIILARTFSFCLAGRADLPRVVVKSSIRREDNIVEGKSYYLMEVEEILDFIRCGTKNERYLFLIDEIFRGTNTIERISAATAVLNHLGGKNMVLVTTHDVELQDLLGGTYAMYHFSEQVAGNRYFFDYRIHPGPTSSRNALKLLELTGYPETVVREAVDLAGELAKKYDS